MTVKLSPRSFRNTSLERALQILCSFTFEKREMTLAELSKNLSLPKSTTYRLVSTLSDYGFLKKDGTTKCHSLGLKLFELGGVVFNSFSLRKVASPYLNQLQAKLGKTIFLGILQDDELVYIDKKEDSKNPIRFSSEIGRHRPPFFGMLGQLLMAYLPDQEVDRILERNPLRPITKKSITDKREFKRRLASIREQGFFVDKEEALDGITGIAASVRDYSGKVVGGVGVGFISSSEDGEGVKSVIREVCKTAKLISQELGYVDKKKMRPKSERRPM
ncbi:MAG: IclR family transcriptional regulator [Thermodesulfobacteriota bacterium]